MTPADFNNRTPPTAGNNCMARFASNFPIPGASTSFTKCTDLKMVLAKYPPHASFQGQMVTIYEPTKTKPSLEILTVINQCSKSVFECLIDCGSAKLDFQTYTKCQAACDKPKGFRAQRMGFPQQPLVPFKPHTPPPTKPFTSSWESAFLASINFRG